MENLVATLIVGVGATFASDVWGFARGRWLRVPAPDYGLVGRWFGHMRRGRFRHDAIAVSAPIPAERVIGWTSHYLIGIAYAALLIGIWGSAWIERPTLGPALIVGIGTVAAPLLVMQPGMGAGLAARRTPRPWAVRMHSLIFHAMFGFGLYAAGWVASYLYAS